MLKRLMVSEKHFYPFQFVGYLPKSYAGLKWPWRAVMFVRALPNEQLGDENADIFEMLQNEFYNVLTSPRTADRATYIFAVHTLEAPENVFELRNKTIPDWKKTFLEEPYSILSPWLSYDFLEYQESQEFNAKKKEAERPVLGILWRVRPLCLQSRANCLEKPGTILPLSRLLKQWLEYVPRDQHPADHAPLLRYLHAWLYLEWSAGLLTWACNTLSVQNNVTRFTKEDTFVRLRDGLYERCRTKYFLPRQLGKETDFALHQPLHPVWKVLRAATFDFLSFFWTQHPESLDVLEWNYCVFKDGKLLDAVFVPPQQPGAAAQKRDFRKTTSLQNTCGAVQDWQFWSFKTLDDAYKIAKISRRWLWRQSLAWELQQMFGLFVAEIEPDTIFCKLVPAARDDEFQFTDLPGTISPGEHRETLWHMVKRLHLSKAHFKGLHPFIEESCAVQDFEETTGRFGFTPLAIWQLKTRVALGFCQNQELALTYHAGVFERLDKLVPNKRIFGGFSDWLDEKREKDFRAASWGLWWTETTLIERLRALRTKRSLVWTYQMPENTAFCLDLRGADETEKLGTDLQDEWLQKVSDLFLPTDQSVVLWSSKTLDLETSLATLEFLLSAPTNSTIILVMPFARHPNFVELCIRFLYKFWPAPFKEKGALAPTIKMKLSEYIRTWLHVVPERFLKQPQAQLKYGWAGPDQYLHMALVAKFWAQFPGLVVCAPALSKDEELQKDGTLRLTVYAGGGVSWNEQRWFAEAGLKPQVSVLKLRYVWDASTRNPNIYALLDILTHPKLQNLTADKIVIELDAGYMHADGSRLSRELLSELASQSLFVS